MQLDDGRWLGPRFIAEGVFGGCIGIKDPYEYAPLRTRTLRPLGLANPRGGVGPILVMVVPGVSIALPIRSSCPLLKYLKWSSKMAEKGGSRRGSKNPRKPLFYPPLIKDRFFAFLTILRIAVNGHIPEIWEISPKFWVFDRFHPFWQNPVFGVFDPPRTPLRGHSGEGENRVSMGRSSYTPKTPKNPPPRRRILGESSGSRRSKPLLRMTLCRNHRVHSRTL